MKKIIFLGLTIIIAVTIFNISCEKVEIKRVVKINSGTYSNLKARTTELNGSFTDLGTNQIDAWGYCYNTTGNPSINSEKTSSLNIPAKGDFTIQINNLSPNTLYYAKAFAQGGSKIIYGKEISFTTLEAGTIEITSPLLNNTWEIGSTQQIIWIDNISETVNIELWRKNGAEPYAQITNSSVPSSGNFEWAVPEEIPAEKGWRIKIISSIDSEVYDFSSEFEIIQDDYINITSPTTNDNWNMEVSYNILWDDNIDENVKISLFKGGNLVEDIITSTISDGIYEWAIPVNGIYTPGTDYTIIIFSTTNPSLFATSSNFEISESSDILVTSPTLGIDWYLENSYDITWTDNIPDNVKIELYKGGTFNSTIIATTDSDGTHNWTISGLTQGNDYTIKVTSLIDANIFDESEAFSISEAEYITVTSPNETNNLEAGSQHEITWLTNISTNFVIDLYKDGIKDPTYGEITSSTSGNSFIWDIPSQLPQGNYKVRVSNVSNTNIFDESETFTISTPAPILTIASPLGGEIWDMGSTESIVWTHNLNDNFNIKLYKGGTYLSDITTNLDYTKSSYAWTIPAKGLTEGSDYSIFIECLNGEDLTQSSYFTISEIPPALVIQPASSETQNSAILNGTVNANTGEVTVYFEWGTTSAYENTVIAVPAIVSGESITPVSANISGLTAGTTYNFRLKAVNSNTTYSTGLSFNTLAAPTLPTVTTGDISNITLYSASLSGNIVDDGGATVSARGFCYSTSQYPTTSDNTTSNGTGTGMFTSNLTGLIGNTTYYVRTYASNSVGTVYGNQQSFYTILLNDGEVINPITGRIWMDKNLGAMLVANSSINSNSYGDLYQWGRASDGHESRNSDTTHTMSNSDSPGHGYFIRGGYPYDWRGPQNDNLWQGVNGINNPCPNGFRLPTIAEWDDERQSWSSNNAAGALASPLKLPMSGARSPSNGFSNVGKRGNYWSSTVSDTKSGYLYFNSTSAYLSSYYRMNGFSVRCIKD